MKPPGALGVVDETPRRSPADDHNTSRFSSRDSSDIDDIQKKKHTQKVKLMDDNLDQAKGKFKQAVGDLTDNDRLKKDGEHDEKAGKVKEVIEDMKDKAESFVDKVKDRLHKD